MKIKRKESSTTLKVAPNEEGMGSDWKVIKCFIVVLNNPYVHVHLCLCIATIYNYSTGRS